jgi:sec-independent protein translocase protein TatC
MKKRAKQNQKNNPAHKPRDHKRPFIEHVHELRQRLFYIGISVGGVAIVTYFVQQHVVNILLRPTHGQQFIYTSPGGGISFLFQVCVYLGIALSIPNIAYQVLRYFEPLITTESRRFIIVGSTVSGILAFSGMVFGYFVGLPAVLHFLLHQFVTNQIHPLLSIQSYFSFVMVYMVGSALLFQVPLILLFINRIKPLKPQKLFKAEKWVIAGAFIVSGLMNPTPELWSQLAVAGPLILMYQVGIGLIWLVNRGNRRPKKVMALLERDAAAQAARLASIRDAKPVSVPLATTAALPITSHKALSVPSSATARPVHRHTVRRRFYSTDMDVRPSYRIAQAE